MGVLDGAHGVGAGELRRPRRRPRRRDRRHRLGLGRRECDRQRPADGGRARQDRRLRLRVPDRRPDLARAGAARLHGHPRATGRLARRARWRRSTPRSTSAPRWSRSRRSATATARASTSRAWSALRTSAAHSCCSTPTRPSDRCRSTCTRSTSTSSSPVRSSTCSPPPASASSTAAAICSSGCVRPRRGGSPTPTCSRWTSRTTRRPPTPAGSRRARRPFRASTPGSRASS